jgi:dTDP-4-dehydrorhamnose reductase
MTRWLVIGSGGMLGTEVSRMLQGREVVTLARSELDITDAAATNKTVRKHHPDVVVNTAAWTAVDLAEEHEAKAFAVNAAGANHVALACARVGASLVHISTDYVFDGSAQTPYAEDAAPCPASAYGRTKAAGEWAVRSVLPDRSWIVRTAWLYSIHGSNFLKTMTRLERERDTIDVVATNADNQHGLGTLPPRSSASSMQKPLRAFITPRPKGMQAGLSSPRPSLRL